MGRRRPGGRHGTPGLERRWTGFGLGLDDVLRSSKAIQDEALRRITEGEPGAAICRECGRPFIVLDARRRFFCNAREQFRHSKREQRRRLAAELESPEIEATVDALLREFDEAEASKRAVAADLARPDPWLPEKVAKSLRRRKRYR